MSATPRWTRSTCLMTDLRLIIFDVDGTLVDSQDMIFAAFAHAYRGLDLPVPDRGAALSFVGMSLDQIFPRLSPTLDPATHLALAQGYRDAYQHIRATQGSNATSPFFPGARAALDTLRAQDWTLLAVATGKSKRGLDKLVAGHELDGYFQSMQTADHHPSKPHPAMVRSALAEAGVSASDAVMIGDTTYDLEMAAAAGVPSIGVTWGYHSRRSLEAFEPVAVINDFAELVPALMSRWGFND